MSYTRREITHEELERQNSFIDSIAGRNYALEEKPLAYVDTYGCQQNEADSEKLRGMLTEMGYRISDTEKGAAVIVINTCAVRAHAETRILGNVGALVHEKNARRDTIIAVCGCSVQRPEIAELIRQSYKHVRLVFGPQELWRFPELLWKAMEGSKRVFAVEPSDGAVVEGIPSVRSSGIKAWLPIMYGCNNFCSYCIVPYVRGRERSRLPENVIAEAKALADAGYHDITLLGQNVNSYGNDLNSGTDFADIIRQINALDGQFLIRFMTSHPKDATEKLFKTMAECEKAAHHIHLPFQSGSDRVLKAMNRHYTRQEYLRLIDTARHYMPDIVLTSDVIVGFPGETEEEFNETLSLVDEVKFDALFTFIYSPREGTPAAAMPDPVSRAEKQVWFDRLVNLQNAISAEKHAALVGTMQKVLVDDRGEGEYNLKARTNGGRLVHLSGPESLLGTFADVKIESSSTWALFGSLI